MLQVHTISDWLIDCFKSSRGAKKKTKMSCWQLMSVLHVQSDEREKDVQKRIRAACLLITNGAFVDAENKKGRPPTTYGLPEVQIAIAQFMEQK